MSLSLRATCVALAASLWLPLPLHAARPLVTEDASILARGYCQLESWVQDSDGNTDAWTSPHCNPGGDWELSAAVGQLRAPNGDGRRGQWVLKAKTVFRQLARNSWGVGLVLTDQFSAGSSIAGDLLVSVPVSVYLFENRVLVHANAGWLRRHDGPNGMTWALGGEWNVTGRAGLTLESFGAGHAPSYFQAGARYDLVPRRVTLDAAIGNRFGLPRADRYIAIGLTVTDQLLR
jgi:hypothetical protein